MRQRVEIICEIGVNHNGSLRKCVELIDAAKWAGADVVKLQASVPDLETSAVHAPEHLKMIESVILSHAELEDAAKYCDRIGIEFLCTPAEERSLEWLAGLPQTKRIKIGSDNLTNHPLLRKAATVGKPLIVSTGMADEDEIWEAVHVLWDAYLPRHALTLLHCTSSYPCPVDQANLSAMPKLDAYAYQWGWSDHTTSLTLPILAMGLGACMIEKHMTYSNEADGPDHKASLEPGRFQGMVLLLREAEAALGDGRKRLMPCEIKTAKIVRKSIVANGPIKEGDELTVANLGLRRPATGRPPSDLPRMIGSTAFRNYADGEMIE